MTATLMSLRGITFVFAALILVPVTAAAKKDKKPALGAPACGASYFPFYAGQVFEYEWLAPEAIVSEGEEPPVEAQGPKAIWPTDLRIEVVKITGGKKSSTISLTETYREHKVETTITCDEKGFRISPQSFFFAGEPGGGIGMELSEFKQDEPGVPSPSVLRPGLNWTSFIKAKVTRSASPGNTTGTVTNGKIEIDRELLVGGREEVETGLGPQRGFRLDVELSGRAAVEPAIDKWRELPPARITMWFADGNGLVRVHNRYGHGWQIKSIVLPTGE